MGDSLIGKTTGSGPVVLGSSPGLPAFLTPVYAGVFVLYGCDQERLVVNFPIRIIANISHRIPSQGSEEQH